MGELQERFNLSQLAAKLNLISNEKNLVRVTNVQRLVNE